jgi:hypothetical protein
MATAKVSPDHLDLTVARLHEHGAPFGCGGAGNGDQRLLVIHIEGAEGEALSPCASVHGTSRLSIRHCDDFLGHAGGETRSRFGWRPNTAGSRPTRPPRGT